jgi:hypothetical protein
MRPAVNNIVKLPVFNMPLFLSKILPLTSLLLLLDHFLYESSLMLAWTSILFRLQGCSIKKSPIQGMSSIGHEPLAKD